MMLWGSLRALRLCLGESFPRPPRWGLSADRTRATLKRQLFWLSLIESLEPA